MTAVIARWFAFILISFVVDLLGLVAVPIALLFCNRESEHLPAAFWPWDNDHDGINGDAGWRGPEHADGEQRAFWWRFVWLAIRNPGNNFGYWLGVARPMEIAYEHQGDPLTTDRGHPGWLFVRSILNGKTTGFCIYIVLRYPRTSRCLRVYLGWKLNEMLNDGTAAEIVCVVNPVMPFRQD